MVALEVGKVGNSYGVVLPREALDRLAEGDMLFLTESPDGYRVTPYDPEFEAQMTEARSIMKRRRNVLRELAK
jgi:putative addiction module antidote